jgi:hypothetical protein
MKIQVLKKFFGRCIASRRVYLPFVIILVLSGCEKDDDGILSIADDNGIHESNSETVNTWIHENMKICYLWEQYLPAKVDKSLYPADFFETLLYKDDRFSWIQEDFVELLNTLSGISLEPGYDFELALLSENSNKLIGYITYIKPASPAQNAGLKRGDFFLAINGQQLTIDNYISLLSETEQPHSLGVVNIMGETISEPRNVQVSAVQYTENPLFLDTVYTFQNKKYGYLVYNFFADDKGDGSMTYLDELNTVFGKFKSNNINELIIDLRYNSGGAISTAEMLASMISNRSSTDLFGRLEYNAILSVELPKNPEFSDKIYFPQGIKKTIAPGNVTAIVPIHKLDGLTRVYFIVTRRTASASELLINALKPYMEVILIGETTYGKNVGSITIYETDPVKQKTNTWGMQPIIARFTNAVGDSYPDGFAPNTLGSELDNFPVINPLGDTNECLLKTALDIINGNPSLRSSGNIQERKIIGSAVDRTPLRKDMYLPRSTSEAIQKAMSKMNL